MFVSVGCASDLTESLIDGCSSDYFGDWIWHQSRIDFYHGSQVEETP
jgi:hypothetical protein